MNNFNISTLEEALVKMVKSWSIADAVYTARPKAAPKCDSFVIVSVVNGVTDRKAIGSTYVAIDLFAKDIANFKNGKKLGWMYDRFVELFPASFEGYIFETTPNVLGDVADDYGFHARMIHVKTILKVK